MIRHDNNQVLKINYRIMCLTFERCLTLFYSTPVVTSFNFIEVNHVALFHKYILLRL